MANIKNLVVYGQKQPNTEGGFDYIIEGVSRSDDNRHSISLEKRDQQMRFEFSDNSTWMCDAATFHELYPETDPASEKSTSRDIEIEHFELPVNMEGPGADRGFAGKIAIKLLRVFGEKTVSASIGSIAKKMDDEHLVNGIPESSVLRQQLTDAGAGLLQVSKDFSFSEFDAGIPGQPFFLFLHGTNSDTLGAFADLSGAKAWELLHTMYGRNVIAFQHRTLTESPLENTVKLVKLLPNNCTLHILSHSRGGLIGDILNKYSSTSGSTDAGFTNDHIELLKKENNRERDIENIRLLNRMFKEKKITVAKFIRVACPAAGTILASKRLDYILNVFYNIFGGDANPYADILHELLSAAVETKQDAAVLPGIEAMSPASPFIKILNDRADTAAVNGSALSVISGNGALSFSLKGLLFILGKLFYWQRSDLVVNTDSMYLGVKRSKEIQYFFDQGPNVHHLNYFFNETTRKIIKNILEAPENAPIPGFKSVFQHAVPAADRAARGLDYGELFPAQDMPSGKRPIVVLLPGIMGSNLYLKSKSAPGENKRVWLDYLSMIFGGLDDLEHTNDKNIAANSVIGTSYRKLASRLSGNYDVIIYPFDWRKQLNDCAVEFSREVDRLLKFDQPVKIIGHSMGGVLVRDFIIQHPDVWERLNRSKGFRLLFLGSPLGGSFRIPAVLFGQDAIINSLNLIDRKHSKKELLKMFVRFPGILSLLPLTTDAENDFADIKTWEGMRDVMGEYDWPLPSPEDLDDFKLYRNNIVKKSDGIDYSNMVYIAGQDKQTPCGYFKDSIPPRKELSFLYTAEGDQSVTWDTGIPPKMTENGTVYYVPVSHGSLANESAIFDGIEDILQRGATKKLSQIRPATRSAEKLFRAPVSFNFDLSQEGLENTVMGVEATQSPVGSKVPLSVTVSNGDLFYASYPVLAGHFINDEILYAEKVIDGYLDKALSSRNELGLYPGEIGSNQLFPHSTSNGFKGAIIVGLGEPGVLTSYELSKTTTQGVLNYLLYEREIQSEKELGITALIIGCGYGGLTIESSMKSIIEGVNNANEKITALFKGDCKTIEHIELVELYNYRALSCMYSLSKIIQNENDSFNIVMGSKQIKNLLGSRKRIPLDVTEEWWNRITVKFRAAGEDGAEPSSMIFSASTGDSREEENQIYNSTVLIDVFIAEISVQKAWSAQLAKTLFELMIPNGLKEKLKRKGHISWVLDVNTAAYPWELLQDSTNNAKPLCINAGMIRQLTINDYRVNIKRAAKPGALIIADPVLDGFIGQLEGAKKEGSTVQKAMQNASYPEKTIIGGTATTIIREFFATDYSIIHLAGHGIFNEKVPNMSGMVIGKNTFLSVFQIQQLPIVPDIVFVNCCHLGAINADTEKFYQDRYKLAANIGTQLIKIGVKAVIAAGWAVDDRDAVDFANTFYSSLFSGNNFGDAVKNARNFVYGKKSGNNTWGAYQCYGDPFFKLKIASKNNAAWSPSYIVPEEAEIHLDNLLSQLEMGKRSREYNLEELDIIVKAVTRDGIAFTGAISEKIARIYLEMGMYKEAIENFEKLLGMDKAEFSFACMEKYCNARVKLNIFEHFGSYGVINNTAPGETLQQIDKIVRDLEILLAAGKTAERLNLLGSTFKRKAMLLRDKKQRIAAYEAAFSYYCQAAVTGDTDQKIYPVTNAKELQLVLQLAGAKSSPDKAAMEATLETAWEEIKNIQAFKEADYWQMISAANIQLCDCIIGDFAEKQPQWQSLTEAFDTIWKKAGSEGKRTAESEHLQFLTVATATEKGILQKLFAKMSVTEYKNYSNDLGYWIAQLKAIYSHGTSVVSAVGKGSASAQRKKKAAPGKKPGVIK